MTNLINPRSKRSVIWAHFEPLDMSYAICNLCEAKLSYRTSVSNLKMHLNKKHPDVQYGCQDGDDEQGTAAPRAVPRPNHERIKLEYYGMQDDDDDDDDFLPISHSKKKERKISRHAHRKSSNNSNHPSPKKPTPPTQASINARIDVDNEFELFGKSIAVQLKKMPLDRALICQEKLQQVMTQERLTQMQKKGDIVDNMPEDDPLIQLQQS